MLNREQAMNKEKSQYQLKMDEDFKRFIPPLSAEERKQLEENILQDGCRDALVVWDKTIIDGHNRYEICTKHQIAFTIDSICFQSREGAISWICANQLGRRNITEETRYYLIGKRYEMEKKLNEERNASGVNQHTEKEVCNQNGNKPTIKETVHRTGEKLGKEYRIGSNTVVRYGEYASALDTICDASPELHAKIMSGQLKITQKNVVELSRLSPPGIRRVEAELPKDPTELIRYMDARGLFPKNTSNKTQLAQMQIGAIKDMPQYDPDDIILSLVLTVPSWVSSINRVLASAKFSEVSGNARKKLASVLNELKSVAGIMLSAIEEDK